MPAAFDAWLRVFVPKFETLTGADGGVWVLENELTWPLFKEVVRAMRKGKAVGAGGLASEVFALCSDCLLYTSPSPRDATLSRMPSSA